VSTKKRKKMKQSTATKLHESTWVATSQRKRTKTINPRTLPHIVMQESLKRKNLQKGRRSAGIESGVTIFKSYSGEDLC